MKHMIGVLALLVVVGLSLGEAQTLQAGIASQSSSTFVVRAMVSGGAITNKIFSNVVVTVYWETAAGLTLGSPAGSYAVVTAGGIGTEGLLSYQKYASTPNVNITMADGSTIDLFTVTVTGAGPAVFQLGQPAGGTGNWYVELGGDDYTNTGDPFYQQSTEMALPVTLVSFAGTASASQGGVVLTWKTASEVNNYGYTVQRRSEAEADFTDLSGAFVEGKGTTTEAQSYSYLDKSIAQPGTYSYRLKQVDLDGTIHYSPSVIVVITLTDVAEVAPKEFQLAQNYPNPFNPSTQVKFSVQSTEHAVVKVYNMLGEEVTTLFDGVAEAGRYYVARFDATNLATGMYIYRLTTDTKSDVKKMLLVK
jgi:hypothetical protein